MFKMIVIQKNDYIGSNKKIQMLEKEIEDLEYQISKTERRLNLYKRRLCRDLKLLDEIKGKECRK